MWTILMNDLLTLSMLLFESQKVFIFVGLVVTSFSSNGCVVFWWDCLNCNVKCKLIYNKIIPTISFINYFNLKFYRLGSKLISSSLKNTDSWAFIFQLL